MQHRAIAAGAAAPHLAIIRAINSGEFGRTTSNQVDLSPNTPRSVDCVGTNRHPGSHLKSRETQVSVGSNPTPSAVQGPFRWIGGASLGRASCREAVGSGVRSEERRLIKSLGVAEQNVSDLTQVPLSGTGGGSSVHLDSQIDRERRSLDQEIDPRPDRLGGAGLVWSYDDTYDTEHDRDHGFGTRVPISAPDPVRAPWPRYTTLALRSSKAALSRRRAGSPMRSQATSPSSSRRVRSAERISRSAL
jgi:hypothetical protein